MTHPRWYAWVYRIYDHDGRLLYIGSTWNPDKRPGEHMRKPWGSSIAAVMYTPFESRAEAYKRERDAIFAEQPIYNVLSKTRDEERYSYRGGWRA